MITTKIPKTLLTTSLLCLAPFMTQAQDLLYAENFGTNNSYGRDYALGTPETQWFGIRDGNTNNNLAAESYESYLQYDGFITGPALNNSPVVVTTPEPPDQTLGVFYYTTVNVYNSAFFTREYTGINSEDIGSISWDMLARGTGGGDFNVLLKIGGNWYTPDTGLSINTPDTWTHFSTDLSTVTWVRLDGMDPENNSAEKLCYIPFRIEGTSGVELPTGTVQAFGILMDNMTGGRLVMDNYQIYSPPPPPPEELYAENFGTNNSYGRDYALGTPETQWFGIRSGNENNNLAAESYESYLQYDGFWAGPAVNNSPVVVTTPEPADQSRGVFYFTTVNVYNVTFFTREYTGINAEDIGWISWDMLARGTGDGDFNILLKIGGNWYTPDSGFSISAPDLWTHFSVDLSTVTWVLMDGMDPENNSAEKLSYIPFRIEGTTPVSLPTGTVEAFGILLDNMTGGRLVMDNYKIFTPGALLESVQVGMAIAGAAAEVSVESSVEGRYYQAQVSTDGMATWNNIGNAQPGNGGTLILALDGGAPLSGEKVFYRVVDSI